MILDTIVEQGFYLSSPNRWEQDQTELDELFDLDLIQTLADCIDTTDYNSCYYYVAKGNPLKLHWVRKENGQICLTSNQT